MKSALLLFAVLLLSSSGFAQNRSMNTPTIYIGSTAAGGTLSSKSKLITIHTPQETAHDSTYSILDAEISIGGKVYCSKDCTSKGLLLTPEMAKGIELLKSSESFSILMTVKGSDGVLRKLAATFYV